MPVVESGLTGIFVSTDKVSVALNGEQVAEYDCIEDLIAELDCLREQFTNAYEVC